MSRTARVKKYTLINLIAAVLLTAVYSDNKVDSYNSTLLAFHYGYGLIPRGLLGSIYTLADRILPWDLMNYRWVLIFSWGMTLLFYFVLSLFFYFVLRNCREEYLREAEAAILFLSIFVFSTFSGHNNFGRVDLELLFVSLIGVILIVRDRGTEFVPLLAAAGVLFHEGYVFMYANLILVMLFYRWMKAEGKKRFRWARIFIETLAVSAALFAWFYWHARDGVGSDYVTEILHNAMKLGCKNMYHPTLIDAEIFGYDLTLPEHVFHLENFVQMPIFLILFLPYLIPGALLCIRLLKGGKDLRSRLAYLAFALGGATLLPNFLLKVDYGRWILAAVCYYSIVLLAMLRIRDDEVGEVFCEIVTKIRSKGAFTLLLLVYPLIFVPLQDVYVTAWIKDLSDWLDQRWLHLY